MESHGRKLAPYFTKTISFHSYIVHITCFFSLSFDRARKKKKKTDLNRYLKLPGIEYIYKNGHNLLFASGKRIQFQISNTQLLNKKKIGKYFSFKLY